MPSSPSIGLPENVLQITLALALTSTLAAAAALAVGRLARQLLSSLGPTPPSAAQFARATIRIVRLMTFLVVFAVLAFPALDLAGVDLRVGLRSDELGSWAAATGIRILALVLTAYVVSRILAAVLVRAEQDMSVGIGLDGLERRKRAQTIAQLVRRVLSSLIWATLFLIVLRELDVDITPVLTGAGILGLAVGFGAQTLVRDVISGFFLIIEDQVRIGDVAMVNGTGGLVEQINLRTIVLRDLEGVVHVFPNGEIKTLANRTKDFSFYVIDLGVEYAADTDRVVGIIRRTSDEMMADPAYGPSILAPVEVLGVDDFKESAVTIKFRVKTVPLKQWEVGRELRRRLKMALEREGLRLPFRRLDIAVTQLPAASPEGGRVPPDSR